MSWQYDENGQPTWVADDLGGYTGGFDGNSISVAPGLPYATSPTAMANPAQLPSQPGAKLPNNGPQGGYSFNIPASTGSKNLDQLRTTNNTAANNITDYWTGTVNPSIGAAQDANNQGVQWDRFAVDKLGQGQAATQADLNRIMANQAQNSAMANANGQQILAGNRAYGQGLQASNSAALGNYQTNMTNLLGNPGYTSGPYQGIAFDPQGLQAQTTSLNNFNDIYGGSLDYQAAQAQASLAQAALAKAYSYQSDPRDIARMTEGVDMARDLALGKSEWNDAMKDSMAKYKALTSPEITDQERFMMEQMRQQTEGQMRGAREALSQDLAMRGINSGAAEQVGLGMYNQQVGQDRVLNELGAGANAISRSMSALQGYANEANMGRQAELQSKGLYIDAAGQLRDMNDRVGMFNTSEKNQTERLNATNKTNVNITNANNLTSTSQFNAAQQNNASANNQATRLAGAQGYATQANNIRNSNDAVNMFNKDQQMTQERFLDTRSYNEAVRQQSVNNDLLSGTVGTNSANMGIQNGMDDRALAENATGWARNTATNQMQGGVADTGYQMTKDYSTALSNHGANIGNAGVSNAQLSLAGGAQNTGNQQVVAGLKAEPNRLGYSQELSDKAIQSLEDQDPGGLLGTGLLGKNGILGLKGVKYL